MIQTQYVPERIVGDGSTAALPFTWRILAKSDVIVLAKDPDTGEVTTLELDSDYTIDDADVNNDDGGDVVLDDAAAWDGFDIWIIRNTARTQLVNIEPGGTFSAAQVMTALDRLTMIAQELYYRLRKALKFADASTFVDLDVPDLEAGEALHANEAADSVEWKFPDGALASGVVDVTAGQLTVSVTFDDIGTGSYIPFLQSNFGGDPTPSSITATGFTVTFTVPAPSGAKLVYRVFA